MYSLVKNEIVEEKLHPFYAVKQTENCKTISFTTMLQKYIYQL